MSDETVLNNIMAVLQRRQNVQTHDTITSTSSVSGAGLAPLLDSAAALPRPPGNTSNMRYAAIPLDDYQFGLEVGLEPYERGHDIHDIPRSRYQDSALGATASLLSCDGNLESMVTLNESPKGPPEGQASPSMNPFPQVLDTEKPAPPLDTVDPTVSPSESFSQEFEYFIQTTPEASKMSSEENEEQQSGATC